MIYETKSPTTDKGLQPSKASDRSIFELPAGVPRPHAARDWGKWLEKELADWARFPSRGGVARSRYVRVRYAGNDIYANL